MPKMGLTLDMNVRRQDEIARSIVKQEIGEQTPAELVNLALRGRYLADLILDLQRMMADTNQPKKGCNHSYRTARVCIHCGCEHVLTLIPVLQTLVTSDNDKFDKKEDIGNEEPYHKSPPNYWAKTKDWVRTRVFKRLSRIDNGTFAIIDVTGEPKLELCEDEPKKAPNTN